MLIEASLGAKILIVEDEEGLVTTLKDRLRKEGYSITVAKNGLTGFDLASREGFDLILLDLMLPGRSGLTVCQKLRDQGSNVPILMLTARRQTVDKVAGLRIGADDYLTKPFQMRELLARVEALLRRAARPAGNFNGHYRFGDVELDVRSTEVKRDGKVVALSAREFQLLRYFVDHQGVTISREELLKEVWGYGVMPSTRTVDVHVAWLRQKLESNPKNPQHIITVQGLGYKFTA